MNSAKRALTVDPELCCAPLAGRPMSEFESTRFAAILGALADPVRLRLLSIIAASGEVCSCNLEAPLHRSQPTISHHTRVLAEAGLIVGTRRGKWTWWQIVPERLSEVCRILGGA